MSDEELANYSAAIDEIYRLRSALAYEALTIERRLGPAASNGRWSPAKEQIARIREAARGQTESHTYLPHSAMQDARKAAGMEGLTNWQWENERGGVSA